MHLAVTIRHADQEFDELKALIVAVRRALISQSVTVLEAPQGMTYPHPFPLVTISDDNNRSHLYGVDAVEKLRDLAHPR
jgi:hypothetical protein